MARDLLASHLLNAVIAVVDSEDFLAAKNGNTDGEDVLADQHVTAMQLASHGELAAAHVRHEQDGYEVLLAFRTSKYKSGASELTVDKGIFKLGASPDTALVLLGILVSLSVAVLAEGGPEVERVDVCPGLALVSRLLAGSRDTVEAVKGLRGDHRRLDGRSVLLMLRHLRLLLLLRRLHRRGHANRALLVARDHAVEVVRLGIAGRLAQRNAAALVDAIPAGINILCGRSSRRRVSLRRQHRSGLV